MYHVGISLGADQHEKISCKRVPGVKIVGFFFVLVVMTKC